MGRIFHIATEADWQAARRAGRYTTSTLGRTLAEEGFIHASRADQWQEVRRRYYADVSEPLVLLVVDTDLLEAPVVEETPPGGTESFPHVYGAIDPGAVVRVLPLAADGRRSDETFGAVFLREMFVNLALGMQLLLMLLVGVLAGRAADPDLGPWLGLVAGLVCGLAVIVVTNQRRRRP